MSEKKKILVIDDEPDLVRYLTVLLQNNDYSVVGAADGQEGFDKAASENPDLIILDISMPKESGLKMYRRLHDEEKLKDIPVIMLTGVSREFERFISSRKLVNPPAAYFEKPVNDKDLINKLKKLVG